MLDRLLLAGFCLSLIGLQLPRSGHCLSNGVATTTHDSSRKKLAAGIRQRFHRIYPQLSFLRFCFSSVSSVSSVLRVVFVGSWSIAAKHGDTGSRTGTPR